jgi:phospholipid/cholesterol/gamma-HCH transport system permease protein
MQVKNDTESIGINTTKSVVESIFAVIICDAVFSIIFTELGF